MFMQLAPNVFFPPRRILGRTRGNIENIFSYKGEKDEYYICLKLCTLENYAACSHCYVIEIYAACSHPVLIVKHLYNSSHISCTRIQAK